MSAIESECRRRKRRRVEWESEMEGKKLYYRANAQFFLFFASINIGRNRWRKEVFERKERNFYSTPKSTPYMRSLLLLYSQFISLLIKDMKNNQVVDLLKANHSAVSREVAFVIHNIRIYCMCSQTSDSTII